MEKEKAIELAIKEADRWINIDNVKVINQIKTDDGWFIHFGGDDFLIIGPAVYFVSNNGDVHVVPSSPSDPEKAEYLQLTDKQEAKELAIKEASKWINTQKFHVINSLKVDDGYFFEFGREDVLISGPSLYFVTNDGEVELVGSSPFVPRKYEYLQLLYQQEENNIKNKRKITNVYFSYSFGGSIILEYRDRYYIFKCGGGREMTPENFFNYYNFEGYNLDILNYRYSDMVILSDLEDKKLQSKLLPCADKVLEFFYENLEEVDEIYEKVKKYEE